jgi:hypothetical protein
VPTPQCVPPLGAQCARQCRHTSPPVRAVSSPRHPTRAQRSPDDRRAWKQDLSVQRKAGGRFTSRHQPCGLEQSARTTCAPDALLLLVPQSASRSTTMYSKPCASYRFSRRWSLRSSSISQAPLRGALASSCAGSRRRSSTPSSRLRYVPSGTLHTGRYPSAMRQNRSTAAPLGRSPCP